MKKRLFAIMLAVCVAVSLVACSTPQANPGGDASGDSKEKKAVGICMPTKEQTNWVKQADALVANLSEAGFDTMVEFAEDSPERQILQIENMLTKGVDYLMITPVDGATLTESVAKAKENGVVVIASDRHILNTDQLDYYITFDLELLGVVQGEYIESALGLKDGKGPFNLEIFSGSLDDANSQPFYNGAMKVLQPYIDSGKLVVKSGQTAFNVNAIQGWSGSVAQARMDNILSSYYSTENVDAILCAADCLSIGVVSSLNSIGYGSAERPFPVITGADCEITAIKYIQEGKMAMTVLVDPFLFSDLASDVIVAIDSGNPLPPHSAYNNNAIDVPTYQYDARVIDKNNWQYLIEQGIYTEDELK